MQPPFEPGDVAYVRRNATVDEAGDEVVVDATTPDDGVEGFETVLQEVLVLSVEGTRAVVAHSGGRHRYHVGWLLDEPDGPEPVRPRAWNP